MSILPPTTPFAPGHLLIPVDGTPLASAAVAAALALAPAPGTITLLQVIDGHGLAGEATLEAVDRLARDLRQRLPSTTIETRLAHGDPATEILATAGAVHPDMIAMATSEHRSPSGPARRHVSVPVAQATSLPVLVAHPYPAEWRPLRIVAPLDGSLRSLQALPVAAGIATPLNAPVHLVAVIDPAASLPAAYAWSCPSCDPDLQCQANDLLDQAERSLRAAGVTVTSDLLLGETAPALLETIQPDDVVVMTTRGAGHREGSHAGSVATRMLRDTPVPVVVFQPRIEPAVVPTSFEPGWLPDNTVNVHP